MEPSTPSKQAEMINLLDYLEAIVKHRRKIVFTALAAFVVSVICSLLLPKVYVSTAKILPPQQDQGLMGMMLGQAGGGMASLAGDLLGKGNSADLYVGILSCDAMSDSIIDRFKLMQVYGKKYRVDTYGSLRKHVEISAGKKDGIISITVEDSDPRRAAEIANAYVGELGDLMVKLNITNAGENKAFLGERLAKAKADLSAAEDALESFQAKNKMLSVTDQTAAAISGIAQVKAQLVSQEVQLAALRRQFTDSSPEVKNARSAVANLQGQIARMEGAGSGGAIPAVGSVPQLGQSYLRLMREFKMQETLVELLTKQYELAKLNEVKDVDGVQVIQKARVPDRKAKPQRSLIVLASTFAAGFAAVLYALIREAGGKLSPEDRERLSRMRCALLGNGSIPSSSN